MTERDAEKLLADADLIPVLQGTIRYIKELASSCLDEDIPVVCGMPPGAGKG